MSAGFELAPTCTPAQDGAGPSSLEGHRVQDRYLIEGALGEGGMGTVYRARHIALDREVALKVLRRHHSQRWVSRQRFEREARALAKLSHPNVVAVSDYGIDEGAPFLVMELLEGESLQQRLGARPLSTEEACRFSLELLEGLSFAHERGLVHRDIKPANVFVERPAAGGERIKLLDFGLAKFLESSGDVNVTRSGEVWGTPAYMAPEQITGDTIDARTDVYALGLLLFEMFAGRRAFEGTEGQLLQQHMVAPLPALPAELAGTPLGLALRELLTRATQKEPRERFANATEMAEALRAALSRVTRPAARRPGTEPGLLARVLRAGALLLSLLAFTAILFFAGVIYLLSGPDGATYKPLLERALPPSLDRK